MRALHWHHNDHDGVSNHQLHGCLLNCLFRCRSKKTSKLRITGLCEGNSPGLENSLHKGPVISGKCFHLMTSSWGIHLSLMDSSHKGPVMQIHYAFYLLIVWTPCKQCSYQWYEMHDSHLMSLCNAHMLYSYINNWWYTAALCYGLSDKYEISIGINAPYVTAICKFPP